MSHRVGSAFRSAIRRAARTYIRHAPVAAGKYLLWRTLLRRLEQEPCEFATRTVFGGLMAGSTRDLFHRRIYYFGVWEPDLTRWLAGRLRRGDVFADVGAYAGYFSLLAARLVGASGGVVAVEASPDHFRLLEANLRRNRTTNVRALNVAAADRPGTAAVFAGPDRHRGLTTLIAGSRTTFEAEVPAFPLADLLTADERRRVRLIKIDVEGAEAAVIDGLVVILDDARDDLELVVEVHPDGLAQRGRTPGDIVDTLASRGFHAYMLENPTAARHYAAPRPPRRPARLQPDGADRLPQGALVVFSRTDASAL